MSLGSDRTSAGQSRAPRDSPLMVSDHSSSSTPVLRTRLGTSSKPRQVHNNTLDLRQVTDADSCSESKRRHGKWTTGRQVRLSMILLLNMQNRTSIKNRTCCGTTWRIPHNLAAHPTVKNTPLTYFKSCVTHLFPLPRTRNERDQTGDETQRTVPETLKGSQLGPRLKRV